MLTPIKIELEDNFINFRYEGDDDIIYTTQKNQFLEETGLTIKNPDFNIPAYVLKLSRFGEHLICGHIIDNIVGYLKNAELENIFLIIDFEGVTDISDNFAEQYIRFILSTKSKTISINQNTNISNTMAQYLYSIIDVQGVNL